MWAMRYMPRLDGRSAAQYAGLRLYGISLSFLRDSTRYGPLETGTSFAIWSNGARVPSARIPHFGENTGRSPAISGAPRSACLNSKRTVARSTTTARLITANCALNIGDACGLVNVSNEYLTSAAVIGSPFEKRAAGLM